MTAVVSKTVEDASKHEETALEALFRKINIF
jgi:hypothetical protein